MVAKKGFLKANNGGDGGVSLLTINTFPIKGASDLIDSGITYNPTLDRYESTKDFFAPTLISNPGSIEIGDSIISSGGREITAKSASTGNMASFELQLFDEIGFKKSTSFDETQVAALFPVQDTDDTVASGVVDVNVIQVVQADVQLQRIRIKPNGGVITDPFTFEIRINSSTVVPAYKETIELTDPDLVDLGGGVWELTLANPVIFDAGSSAYISSFDIDLLGGNGFTGPILFGDPTNSDFFPFIVAYSVPVVRKNQATEEYVQNLIAACAGFKGVYADIAALELAHPTSELGSIATVTSPNGNLFFWNGSAWEDTGTGYIGDMLKLYYDPTGVNGDAFSMGNMAETASKKIFSNAERSNLNNQSNTNTGDQDLSGLPTISQVNDTNGYEISIDDSTQTVGEINVADGVQTQITNNGLGANYANLPSTVTEFVDTPDGDALLDQEDGIYSISIQFTTRPATRDKAFLIEFIAQNGGSPISIFSRSLRFTKEITTEEVSVSFTTPAIAAIVNLPISVYITTDGTSTDVWGQSLSVSKNNAPIV